MSPGADASLETGIISDPASPWLIVNGIVVLPALNARRNVLASESA